MRTNFAKAAMFLAGCSLSAIPATAQSDLTQVVNVAGPATDEISLPADFEGILIYQTIVTREQKKHDKSYYSPQDSDSNWINFLSGKRMNLNEGEYAINYESSGNITIFGWNMDSIPGKRSSEERCSAKTELGEIDFFCRADAIEGSFPFDRRGILQNAPLTAASRATLTAWYNTKAQKAQAFAAALDPRRLVSPSSSVPVQTGSSVPVDLGYRQEAPSSPPARFEYRQSRSDDARNAISPAQSRVNLLEQAVGNASASWFFNRYDHGSMHSVIVSKPNFNGGYVLHGEYTFNNGAVGHVDAVINNGNVLCLEFWDTLGRCGINPVPIATGSTLQQTTNSSSNNGGKSGTMGDMIGWGRNNPLGTGRCDGVYSSWQVKGCQ